ncbi:MAG: hypothetical protein B7X03_01290 [Parcubacteria group bacterium 21-58-10]|nr:MAG: hypothetical protein B7X03_01290 [Parcubacteria group bacterium 21-58-10]
MRKAPPAAEPPAAIATATYACDGGKTITAAYYAGAPAPAPKPGEPPTPTGSVALALSDGRGLTLAQTISADGTRYANRDESFIFWSKGNGAIVLEDGHPGSYTGCIVVAPPPTGERLPQIFASSTAGFSIRLPDGYVPKPYLYQEFGPGKDISGIKFTIAPSVATGTNLAADSYVSVEQIPQVQECSANLFLDQPGTFLGQSRALATQMLTDDGTTYSVASSTGAGAGNRYFETVYALPGTNPCTAVRYFIHYGVFENYPPGAVQAFNEPALLATFDAIRRTLTLAP